MFLHQKMERRYFVKSLTILPLAGVTMNLNDLFNITDDLKPTDQFPVLFIGHGSPMNAILDNTFTRRLTELGISFKEKPKAILVISAHWLTRGTNVMVSEKPKTIHDFGGFPNELYQIEYPAIGSPVFAKETKKLIKTTNTFEDENWGLDHGAWTILRHIFPNADIPVFQLSIDYTKEPQYHYNLASEIKALRNKGVLIIGSGNIVHNLYQIDFDTNAKPFSWAIEFDDLVKDKLLKKDYSGLINYSLLGEAARLSIPTNDHYLPMLYTLGLSGKDEQLKFVYEEIQNSSISMRCFQIG
jgi:4,5-DOPA dioxygenase extradiol